jgi:hypothetical protein
VVVAGAYIVAVVLQIVMLMFMGFELAGARWCG